MALDTVGWHDRTTADHQQQLNTWQRDAIRRFRWVVRPATAAIGATRQW